MRTSMLIRLAPKYVDIGATREVFLFGRFAFKFPKMRYGWAAFLRGLLANLQEITWSGNDELLCPVLFALPLGLLVVMPRCRPFHGSPPVANALPIESKEDSWGWLGTRLVAVDYGGWAKSLPLELTG